MKALIYYRSKLSTIIPEELMPTLSDEPSVTEIQSYITTLRNIFCSMSYQTIQGREKIISRVLEEYEGVCIEGSKDRSAYKNFINKKQSI